MGKNHNYNWNNIEPHKVSLLTMLKQKSGFTKKRFHTNFTSDNFLNYFHIGEFDLKETVHRKTNINLGFYVKQAIDLLKYKLTDNTLCKIEFINNCWKKNVLNHFSINDHCNYIPIIDISSHFDIKSKYNAIGMGILICQMSKFNRLILVENDFICLNFKYDDDFIDIIREVMPFVEHSVNLRIDRILDYIFDGFLLIQEPINFVFLSNSNTILKSQELFFEKYNKYIYWIFWNMGDETDNFNSEFSLYKDCLYVSGSSPTLFFHLNKNSIYQRKINTYLYLNDVMNTGRYINLASYLCKYFSF